MKLQCLIVLAAGLLLAADKPEEAVKKEKAMLQGVWTAVSREVGVKKEENKNLANHQIIISDSQIKIKDDTSEREYAYELDLSQDPKGLDLSWGVGRKRFGIYKLEGDKLTLAMDREVRPKEFTAKEGSTVAVVVFKRVKQ